MSGTEGWNVLGHLMIFVIAVIAIPCAVAVGLGFARQLYKLITEGLQ